MVEQVVGSGCRHDLIEIFDWDDRRRCLSCGWVWVSQGSRWNELRE